MGTVNARYALSGPSKLWLKSKNPASAAVRRERAELHSEVAVDAVGTLIAERPPHRTVRAAFPHTAPTSGV